MLRAVDLVVLFGLGALVGTGVDQIHVRAGVLFYPSPSEILPGQPLWVPLLFGGAGAVLPMLNAALLRLAPRSASTGSVRAVAAASLWFFAAYASTALLQSAPILLGLGLVLVWAGRVALGPAMDKLLAGPLFAVVGSLFEAGLSSTGAFHYRRPDVLLVPVWLPGLYLHASLLTREACLAFRSRSRGATAASRAAVP